MIENIYSSIDPKLILHTIFKLDDFSGRIDLVDSKEFLQICYCNVPKGKKPFAHKHLPLDRFTTTTQESYFVVKGKLRVYYYDLDNTELGFRDLVAGECSVTLSGGHTYETLEDSIICEHKNGPYLGSDKDKEKI